MTSRGLRGPDVDWEEKLEVVNAIRKNESSGNAGVLAHKIQECEAMPNEGIA